MGDVPVQKFCPTPEELSSVCSKVICPQDNCKALFQCTSNLNMHLIKHHKINHSGLTAKRANTQYFCPALACPYSKDSKKHFTKLKYLKQHFLKVHAAKEFVCEKCKKKFSTETFLALHNKNCGKKFTCICGSHYNSSEAILTHIKRKGKGHDVMKNNGEFYAVSKTFSKKNEISVKKERLIYPKLTGEKAFPVHYIAAVALSELSASQNFSKAVDKAIQTEVVDFDISKDSIGKCFKRLKNSQQTQTTSGKNKKLKISIHTQTNNDYLKRKGKGQVKTTCRRRKKSMETQTKDQFKNTDIEEKSCCGSKEFDISSASQFGFNQEKQYNEKINIDCDIKLKNKSPNYEEKASTWLWEMVSSSSAKTSELDLIKCHNLSLKEESQFSSEQESQVNQEFDLNRLCNIETQTEIDAFLTECNEDTNFTLCSTTETQTTDDFDCLLYSNMCTQTCEEVDQLFNFNFVHNETQTAWPDLDDCHELDS